jgi:hypothetical protein
MSRSEHSHLILTSRRPCLHAALRNECMRQPNGDMLDRSGLISHATNFHRRLSGSLEILQSRIVCHGLAHSFYPKVERRRSVVNFRRLAKMRRRSDSSRLSILVRVEADRKRDGKSQSMRFHVGTHNFLPPRDGFIPPRELGRAKLFGSI